MTQEEIIQIPVSSELARRLRPYQSELPRILEWGLRHVERETEVKTGAESALEAMALQKRVVAVLRRAGAIGPDPEEMAQYLAQHENRRWMPIQAGGNSASQMIIEERDSRPWISRHVWQVDELVRRLDQDEIQELIRLVPRLQKEVAGERSGLVQWAREQMAQYADEARPMQGEDVFVGDTTVEAYFALPEAERECIWDELHAAAIETEDGGQVRGTFGHPCEGYKSA